jgi:hypothetical protein
MAKKKSSDVNVTAFEILNSIVGEPPILPIILSRKKKAPPAKNPAAVALGRLGGLKGGKARARKLSAKRRAEIAREAAQARWKSGHP